MLGLKTNQELEYSTMSKRNLDALNIPDAKMPQPNANYKSGRHEDFEVDPFYYHINTYQKFTPIERRGSMILFSYKGVEIAIPEKIIKLKDDSTDIWFHRYILSQILDANGFDGEFELDFISEGEL